MHPHTKPLPSFSEVDRLLAYEPNTGILRWKVYRGPKAKVGSSAGAVRGGYLRIGIRGRTYQAHRLAWLLMTGEEPKQEIDHINRDKLDNRWSNLRDASAFGVSGTSYNSHNINRSGVNGVPSGVQFRNGSWKANIYVDGAPLGLGNWTDYRKAGEVVEKAKALILAGRADEIASLPKCDGGEVVLPLGWEKRNSDFYGVSWDFEKQLWRAHICSAGPYKQLGYFATEFEAAKEVLSYFLRSRIPLSEKLKSYIVGKGLDWAFNVG